MTAIKRIVLIHGAAHGAWCWERVVPLLRAQGFEVDAPDLPGLGEDRTDPRDVTFASYVQRVVDTVSARPGPVLLLGHSMGGGPIAQAAEFCADRIGKLVFLAAMLPANGEGLGMMTQMSSRFPGPTAATGIRPSAIEGAMEFAPELAADAFFNLCDADTARAAVARLRPQATRPLQGDPMTLTVERWGRIPKTYLLCARDQALSPALQRWMCDRDRTVKVIEREWDHSPFLSDPAGLATVIAAEAS